MSATTIAVDVMGGDLGPGAAVDACSHVLQKISDVKLILVGDHESIDEHMRSMPRLLRDRIEILHTTDYVPMHESAGVALRRYKNASMRLAVDLVKNGRVDACVSGGNTSALVAISKFVLKMIAGIKRPAIASTIPSRNGLTLMLDLGANAVCDEQNLMDFAMMGNVVCQHEFDVKTPRVGLLNVGTETGKGGEFFSRVDQQLRATNINYIGFVEGGDIFSDHVDVVVSDGFTGNVALKTMEGFARFIKQQLSTSDDLSEKVCEVVFANNLFDPTIYNGASLLGLNGVVIKSHGASNSTAIRYAIETAIHQSQVDLPHELRLAIGGQSRPEQ